MADDRNRFQQNLALYDALVDKCPGIERKGKTVPYTSANGHMFSLLNKEGDFGMRYSEADKKAFIEEFNSDVLHSHGAVMRGYAMVPDELLKQTDKLIPYLQKSHAYVMSLPPKPTKKK